MGETLKERHDHLIANRPDGVEHDEASCPFCLLAALDNQGGSMGYTQEQLDAAIRDAVDAATGPMQARITELESVQQETEVGQAIAEAVEPLNVQVAELQQQLDTAVVEKAAADQAKADLEAWWSNAITEQTEAEAAAARKDERLGKLKEAAPEKAHAYLEENADRFAAMSDDDFEARLEEYRAIASADGDPAIPTATALTAAREGAATGTPAGSMLGELSSLRRTLTDPRTL